ncbi:MAG: polysaccharide deacetylase family protein, partial [Anaerolineaceae bacterium]|nr:polysaccharide deacetylase family protein [Anaerolineaceae bacterium]
PTIKPSLTATPVPTATLTPTSTLTPTITPTPWELSSFSPSRLRTGVEGTSYIETTCEYLRSRWDETKSSPGTIVVPIMFHSIAQPRRVIKDNTTISMETFTNFMAYAERSGYETITTDELYDFLTTNAKIPEKSMIMILDDRRPGVTELFLPYLEENAWTLTLAWISSQNSDALWSQMEGYSESGYLDVQSHGYNHIYIQPYITEEQIREEIYKPIDLIAQHFGSAPSAYIWPGGNFSQLASSIAEEAGFKLGFTASSRGPLLYNWIPLGEGEREIDNPLMVLPRFWSTAAFGALDEGIRIGEEARNAADAARESEKLWMQLYCGE